MDDGDVVELYSVSGEPGGIPPKRWPIPDELGAIWKRSCGAEDGTQPRRAAANLPPLRHCGEAGPHLLTGPVRVRGAEVGDVLAVEILASEPWVPWGWNALRAGKGALAALDDDDDDDDAFAFLRDGVDETIVIPIDLDARVATPPWTRGVSIPLRRRDDDDDGDDDGDEGDDGGGRRNVDRRTRWREPFFGQLGVAPRPDRGVVSRRVLLPRAGPRATAFARAARAFPREGRDVVIFPAGRPTSLRRPLGFDARPRRLATWN